MVRLAGEEQLAACTACGAALRETRWPAVSKCLECGVYLRNPRPSQDTIRDSYDTGRLYDLWATERGERDRMWRRRLAIVRRFAPLGSLLDVATGDGHFADVARDAGYDVVATEWSRSAAARIRDRGHHVLEGQLRDLDFGSRRFDAVTLWHALEHVPDPGAVLDRARDLLLPHGVLCIAVPNEVRRLWLSWVHRSRDPFGHTERELEIHLTFFTPSSLRRALRAHRLNVVDFGVDNVTLRPNAITELQRIAQSSLSALFGWHLGRAMFVVARR